MTVAVVRTDSTDDSTSPWWPYCTEVLDHLRLPYTSVSPGELPAGTRLLLFPTPPRLDEPARSALDTWVREGGAVVACGGPGDLAELTGIRAGDPVVEGHVEVGAGPWAQPPDVPLHAFGGVPLATEAPAEVLARWTGGEPALATCSVGAGVVVVCGVDLWQTIVRIQQGWPVEKDGEPAADGTAPVDDGILKCDDGIALSYDLDRALPPGAPDTPFHYEWPPPASPPVFHRPHADLWRSVFWHCLLWAAEETQTVLPWLFYWPAGVPAIAHMSHDADGNVDAEAEGALASFAEAGVRVTWCQVFPGGYSPEIFERIGASGHEHALHYNAREDADLSRWGWPYLRAQYAWAQAVTGRERIVSNKNHYTRWEGWQEFYVWCERLGIEIDQTRGPSKLGNVGFPFGTSHVGFHITDGADGYRRLNVLVLPLHTQDLAWAAHESVRDVIVDQALAQHGVAHFLFHGPHLTKRPAVRAACVAVAQAARDRRMPWWTSEEINAWERGRRGVTPAVEPAPGGGWSVRATADRPLAGAAVLLAVPGLRAEQEFVVAEGKGTASVVTRHGRLFVEIAGDLAAGETRWLVRERT